jgi:hypothetical protein
MTISLSRAQVVAVVSAVAVALGALLPWATVSAGIFSRTIQGNDSYITGAAGLVTLGLAALTKFERPQRIPVGLLGLFVIIVAAIDAKDLLNASTDNVLVQIGPGIVVTVAGGLGALFAAIGGAD